MSDHFRRWNIWRKQCLNGPLHKLLVLLKLLPSPTLELTLLPEERYRLVEEFERGITEGMADVPEELKAAIDAALKD